MFGRNTPALYEDPSRLSRMVVISCAAIAALLTFLIVLPPLLSLLGHRSVAASHNESGTAATARDAAAASLDQLSRTAKPIPSTDDIAGAGDSGTAAIADMSRTIVSSAVDTPRRVPQESSPPAPATNGRSPEKSPAWASAIQSTPDLDPSAEVNAEPIAQPPLPPVRPHHHVAVAGVSAVPLPPSRPSAPTEAANTDRDAVQQRLDPF
jgi:hypothetical protein